MMNFTLKGSKKFHNLVNDNDYGCRNKLKENLKGDKREREREREIENTWAEKGREACDGKLEKIQKNWIGKPKKDET